MFLSERERLNIIDYFLFHTNYKEEYLRGIKNHAQLFGMYKRTQERMSSYPKEIIAYYNSHPEIYIRPTDEEIRNMKYEELSALRRELGIRKTSKKVTKTTEAKSTADKARATLKGKRTAALAAEIMISNKAHEEPDYDHEQFLTPEEIAIMYPDCEPTEEELFNRGIIVIEKHYIEEPSTRKHK